MARSLLQQDTQIRNTYDGLYDDSLAAGATLESNATSLLDDLNGLRSQVNRILKADASLNWYDDVPEINSKKRGLEDLNFDLDDIEEKRLLFRTQLLTDISVPAGAKATGTLTFTDNAANGETVTIGAKTYTFQTVLTDVDGNVLIGATTSDSIDNLVAAITLGAGSGTVYAASTTLHPTATASVGAGTSMDAEAKAGGSTGNAIATTDTVTDATWGAATLTGGAGDFVVLSAAGAEVPTQDAAVNGGNALGAVVATLPGDVGAHSMLVVAGFNNIRPKNLLLIVDGNTREVIEGADGRDIWGLLQAEDGVVDGDTFNDTDKQVQISFVKLNATGDGLVPADGMDIGGRNINYAYVQRINLDDVPEQAFLSGIFVDLAGATSTRRQVSYDQQGTTPVQATVNATLDLDSAGIFWKIRDDASADLFTIIEGEATSTSEVIIGAAVDNFTIDAAESDFANQVSIDSDGTQIDIGVTAGTIETTGADDLRIMGAGELYLDDGNQTGSAWVQTDGIKLSDATAEWDDFRTLFGEVSLLDAIVQAATAAGREKTWCFITAGTPINAGTNITYDGGAGRMSAQLGDYSGVTFATDVDIYLNGQLQIGAAGATDDVYPGDDPTTGDLKFTFRIRRDDVIVMVIYGG